MELNLVGKESSQGFLTHMHALVLRIIRQIDNYFKHL